MADLSFDASSIHNDVGERIDSELEDTAGYWRMDVPRSQLKGRKFSARFWMYAIDGPVIILSSGILYLIGVVAVHLLDSKPNISGYGLELFPLRFFGSMKSMLVIKLLVPKAWIGWRLTFLFALVHGLTGLVFLSEDYNQSSIAVKVPFILFIGFFCYSTLLAYPMWRIVKLTRANEQDPKPLHWVFWIVQIIGAIVCFLNGLLFTYSFAVDVFAVILATYFILHWKIAYRGSDMDPSSRIGTATAVIIGLTTTPVYLLNILPRHYRYLSMLIFGTRRNNLLALVMLYVFVVILLFSAEDMVEVILASERARTRRYLIHFVVFPIQFYQEFAISIVFFDVDPISLPVRFTVLLVVEATFDFIVESGIFFEFYFRKLKFGVDNESPKLLALYMAKKRELIRQKAFAEPFATLSLFFIVFFENYISSPYLQVTILNNTAMPERLLLSYSVLFCVDLAVGQIANRLFERRMQRLTLEAWLWDQEHREEQQLSPSRTNRGSISNADVNIPEPVPLLHCDSKTQPSTHVTQGTLLAVNANGDYSCAAAATSQKQPPNERMEMTSEVINFSAARVNHAYLLTSAIAAIAASIGLLYTDL